MHIVHSSNPSLVKPAARWVLRRRWTFAAVAVALCWSSAEASAQDGVVSGRVWSEAGTPLEDVTVGLAVAGDSLARAVVHTGELGYFAFRDIEPGAYVVHFALLGYAAASEDVVVAPGQRAAIEAVLAPEPIALAGITVDAERSRVRTRFEENAGTTVQDISKQSIKSVPGVAESDPLRAVEVLPGVTTVSDISSSFNVRGGSADQNLILLDGVPVLSPFHLGGFFSVFNADMIRRAELRSGGFPAEYGGRVSSVLLLDSDVGDGEFGVDAGVSLLASRVAVNGSLPAGLSDGMGLASARWRVSGRRSYVDVVLRPWTNLPYSLQDLQSVFEGWTKGGNRFRFTAYLGGDRLDGRNGLGNDADSDALKILWDWGNKAIGGSWTRPMMGGGALELRTSFSEYDSDLSFPDFENAEFVTRISETIFGADLERRPTPRTRWKSGLAAKRAWYDNRIQDQATGVGGPIRGGRGEGWELSGYSQLHWEPNPGWLLEAGVRVDHWRPGQGSDETTASPRMAAKRFLEGRRSAVRLSLGRYSQFVHSRRNEELPLGLDVWLLAGDRAPRTISDQVQAGFERFFGEDEAWFGSVEGYYRTFDGVITRNFADDPNDPLDDLLAGRGRAYGLDLFVKRDQGTTTGWLSLSFMRTTRTFADTRSGLVPLPETTYPPVYAQDVDLDLVLQRRLGWELEAGLRFNFSVGRPYTRPLGTYAGNTFQPLNGTWDFGGLDDDLSAVLLGPRNGARYPARHRLDVSLRKEMRWEWGRVTPYVSVLNLYNRKNALFYFYDFGRDPPTRQGLSMTPILPTIGVEMSFR